MPWLDRILDKWGNVLVVVFALGFGALGFYFSQTLFDPQLDIDGNIPDQKLFTITGQQEMLLGNRDKPILVNFWATWCPPCVEELPLLQAMSDEGKVRIVTIATDDLAAIKTFSEKLALRIPVVHVDQVAALDDQLRVSSFLPFSVMLTADGRVVASKAGQLDRKKIESMLSLAIESQVESES